uniref:FBA_2 domain-containing protein n=2 Tax=Caenorhabditis tropicalis TaxID=1561998 RepID=A0A1I7TU01_9PELO
MVMCSEYISDLWTVSELYNFSLLSKRTKGISKRKKGNKVELDIERRLLYFYNRDWVFEQNRFQIGRRRISTRDSKISPFIQATKHFMDVFNCHFGVIDLKLEHPLSNDQLIEIINWLNNTKIEIRILDLTSGSWPMFELFMNTFQKSVSLLIIIERGSEGEGIVHKRLNFKIKNAFYSNPCAWFSLEFLFSMETEYITANKIDLTAEDLNVFLRSWQEGKTNRKMKKILLTTCLDRDLKKVLEGCGGELMDPRTTKHKFRRFIRDTYKDIWVYGGIHIRRDDGRIAVIKNSWNEYETEDRSAYQERELNRNYLENLDIWNSLNKPWYVNEFRIYFFEE